MPSKKRFKVPHLKVIHSPKCIESLSQKDFNLYFYQTELNIKNSLFICSIAHCESIEGARAAISYIQKKYADATHNCSAFQVLEPKSTAKVGYSDDNEPHGTAGKPMLSQLLYSDIGEIACVVTRYFGGTKLGTGGLVRAYQGSVAHALESLPTIEKVEKVCVNIIIDYSNSKDIYHILDKYEIEIQKEEHSADVTYTFALPKDRLDAFLIELQEITQGAYLLL